jgi:hypothetical protein
MPVIYTKPKIELIFFNKSINDGNKAKIAVKINKVVPQLYSILVFNFEKCTNVNTTIIGRIQLLVNNKGFKLKRVIFPIALVLIKPEYNQLKDEIKPNKTKKYFMFNPM